MRQTRLPKGYSVTKDGKIKHTPAPRDASQAKQWAGATKVKVKRK